MNDKERMQIPEKFDLVIAHGNCYDGMTAAWVAKKHSPGAEIVFAQYGDTPPDVSGKRVLVVDFSYRREVLLGMESEAKDLLVLDHHKSAAKDLEGLDCAVFDMERSGAGLAWDYLMEGPRPPIVDHVEDRDLWRFALDGTREFHAAMSCFAMTFENWDKISRIPTSTLVRDGTLIMGFTLLTAKKLAARAQRRTIRGVEVWMVNTPVEFVSETAEVLKDREPHLPVLGWMWDGVRGNYYCSLRSRDDGPDVSILAGRFGGGGHEHAAGFRLDRPPVEGEMDDPQPTLHRVKIVSTRSSGKYLEFFTEPGDDAGWDFAMKHGYFWDGLYKAHPEDRLRVRDKGLAGLFVTFSVDRNSHTELVASHGWKEPEEDD